MNKKILYLSTEIKAREYHAKLLFALNALNRNYQVVIGSKNALKRYIQSTPDGIYIGTGITKVLGANLLLAQSFGHRAVAFDEEGLIDSAPDEFIRTRIIEDIIRDISYFFTWGPRHNNWVKQKVPHLTNYSAVGNMRFELLKERYRNLYERDVSTLKKRYGEYILINSSLAICNHFAGHDFQQKSLVTMIDSREDEAFYQGESKHYREIYESYISLVRWLAPKMAPVKIIIRPHPSEKKEIWKVFNEPNVLVEDKGSPAAWILASKAVIQKNCTTAVEAVYLGKPVITYSVNYNPVYDNEITNKIGSVCKTKEEVWQVLNNLNIVKDQLRKDRQFLSYYVSNMEEDKNVATTILDILDTIEVSAHYDTGTRFINTNYFRYICRKIKKEIKRIIKTDSETDRYQRNKFPGVTLSEIKKDIKLLSPAVGIQSGDVCVTKIYDRFNLYHLTLNNKNP